MNPTNQTQIWPEFLPLGPANSTQLNPILDPEGHPDPKQPNFSHWGPNPNQKRVGLGSNWVY